MRDKQYYIAFLLDKTEFGTQLLRVMFEYKIIEYYGEPEEQEKLKKYFKENHFTKQEPIIVESAEIFDYMPYISAKQTKD